MSEFGMRVPPLILVTDRHLCGDRSLAEIVEAAAGAGLPAVQLREKDLAAGELFNLAEPLRLMVEGRTLFLVNDRVDVAMALAANGVHLPASGLSCSVARTLLGRKSLIGRSVHSVEEAIAAASDGASYVQVGPIFATRSKPGATPAGLALIQAVKAAADIPVIAIGGIDASNAHSVVAAGADGVAVISAIMTASDPARATRELIACIIG